MMKKLICLILKDTFQSRSVTCTVWGGCWKGQPGQQPQVLPLLEGKKAAAITAVAECTARADTTRASAALCLLVALGAELPGYIFVSAPLKVQSISAYKYVYIGRYFH